MKLFMSVFVGILVGFLAWGFFTDPIQTWHVLQVIVVIAAVAAPSYFLISASWHDANSGMHL